MSAMDDQMRSKARIPCVRGIDITMQQTLYTELVTAKPHIHKTDSDNITIQLDDRGTSKPYALRTSIQVLKGAGKRQHGTQRALPPSLYAPMHWPNSPDNKQTEPPRQLISCSIFPVSISAVSPASRRSVPRLPD